MVSTPVNRSGYLLAVVNLQWFTQGLSGGAMPTIGPDAVELAKAFPTALPASALRVDTGWRMVDGRIFH